jgi:hypothetical protein
MTLHTLRPRILVALVVAAVLLGLGAAAGWEAARAQHVHSHMAMNKPGWLLRLAPDARPAAIERQLRGFDTTMAEVAYRYTEMYWGGVDGNWDYAAHQAQNLTTAFTLGLERRPEYRKNADALFLKGAFPPVMEAIKARGLHHLPRGGVAPVHQDRRADRAPEPAGEGLTLRASAGTRPGRGAPRPSADPRSSA